MLLLSFVLCERLELHNTFKHTRRRTATGYQSRIALDSNREDTCSAPSARSALHFG